ncbi:hypothetical protein [Christensenella tenuis]|jgi:predicted PurR-regulated permease PerM|uniref:Uncharacterized protein n=1 Tax=Christensenella tenuis TaxID=2763033 RepID=A0ABR7ECX1_9FIRM|nr:hypothetical protein [Christensenella tenuis]MBC5647636.1 hypothetical protein [Christensenella tenuis]
MEEEKREVREGSGLERIEALLAAQAEHNKKLLRSSRVHTVILLVFVVVFAAGIFAVNGTLASATKELPVMLESITNLTDTAAKEIGRMDDIDFDALNETIKGISTIRFDVLNESIQALTDIIKPFANFMGALS